MLSHPITHILHEFIARIFNIIHYRPVSSVKIKFESTIVLITEVRKLVNSALKDEKKVFKVSSRESWISALNL
jgi:hypothetical protein